MVSMRFITAGLLLFLVVALLVLMADKLGIVYDIDPPIVITAASPRYGDRYFINGLLVGTGKGTCQEYFPNAVWGVELVRAGLVESTTLRGGPSGVANCPPLQKGPTSACWLSTR